jgi:hypothetical protein
MIGQITKTRPADMPEALKRGDYDQWISKAGGDFGVIRRTPFAYQFLLGEIDNAQYVDNVHAAALAMREAIERAPQGCYVYGEKKYTMAPIGGAHMESIVVRDEAARVNITTSSAVSRSVGADGETYDTVRRVTINVNASTKEPFTEHNIFEEFPLKRYIRAVINLLTLLGCIGSHNNSGRALTAIAGAMYHAGLLWNHINTKPNPADKEWHPNTTMELLNEVLSLACLDGRTIMQSMLFLERLSTTQVHIIGEHAVKRALAQNDRRVIGVSDLCVTAREVNDVMAGYELKDAEIKHDGPTECFTVRAMLGYDEGRNKYTNLAQLRSNLCLNAAGKVQLGAGRISSHLFSRKVFSPITVKTWFDCKDCVWQSLDPNTFLRPCKQCLKTRDFNGTLFTRSTSMCPFQADARRAAEASGAAMRLTPEEVKMMWRDSCNCSNINHPVTHVREFLPVQTLDTRLKAPYTVWSVLAVMGDAIERHAPTNGSNYGVLLDTVNEMERTGTINLPWCLNYN